MTLAIRFGFWLLALAAMAWAFQARLGPLDLAALKVTDFQMVMGGDRYNYTGDCARTTPLFNDAFELGGLAKWSGAVP